jgi:hypothetical protein
MDRVASAVRVIALLLKSAGVISGGSDAHEWGQTYRRSAVAAMKRA